MSDSAQEVDPMPMAGAKRKLSSVLDVVSDLERRLPLAKSDNIVAAALADTVRRQITQKRTDHLEDDAAAYSAAVTLWNLVLRLERDLEQMHAPVPAEYRPLLIVTRVFAFFIMHSSTRTDTSSLFTEDQSDGPVGSQILYLMGIAIRVARLCIAQGEIELGRLVSEQIATYKKTLDQLFLSPSDESATRQKTKFEQLKIDYTIVQLLQLSREGRLDDADQLYKDAEMDSAKITFGSVATEKLTEALFQIGKDLLLNKDFIPATLWLDRSYECVSKADLTTLCTEVKELRLTIIHSLAIASLGVRTSSGNQKAQELVQTLQSDKTEKDSRRIHLVQLELFASPLSDFFDADGYANVILQMIAAFTSTKADFQLLHHHIQKLHGKSPKLGCKVLDSFLLSLRHREDAIEYVEKLIITRVWLLAHQRETQEELDVVQNVLEKLRVPISADTASAAQTLMWKRIEQGYREKNYATAIRWCRLALCHIFEAGGQIHRPLIQRKLLSCCIENNDLDTAKSVYIQMPEPTRDEPVTKYLLYKLSIKADDLDMATECLRGINVSAEKMKLLQACILHARHEKAPLFMVKAMKRLADAINHDQSSQVHAAALFRCTILMLREMIGNSETGVNSSKTEEAVASDQAVHDLVDVFEGVVDAMKIDCDLHTDAAERHFTIDELEWFCRAAYNLGLKYSGTWDLRHTVRILEACVKITNMFPVEKEVQAITDLLSKRLACHFLISSALAALVRRCTLPEEKGQRLKDCHAMREHVRAFHMELKKLGKTEHTSEASDWLSKLSVLLVYDFEGAIHLGDWDELESICEMAASCDDPNTLRVFGDTLLRSQALVPGEKFVSTMRLLVNKLHCADNVGDGKLVQYYLCLFQAALYRDNDAAFQILEEVKRMIDDGLVSETKLNWPEEEIQFLAATAFNEGIDWFAAGREDRVRHWVLSAASLAEQCHDGGKLKSLITSRFNLLKIGDLEIKQSVELDTEGLVPMNSSAITMTAA